MEHKTKAELLFNNTNFNANLYATTQMPFIYEAMDIFSKQECIGLIQFMYASCAETIPNTRPAKWNIDLNTQVTFEQLYNLYLQSKL